MNVLCFDIASGGLSAAIFDEHLIAAHAVEEREGREVELALGRDG